VVNDFGFFAPEKKIPIPAELQTGWVPTSGLVTFGNETVLSNRDSNYGPSSPKPSRYADYDSPAPNIDLTVAKRGFVLFDWESN
jgi:hypothetical protein